MNNPNQGGSQEAPKTSPESDKPNQQQQGQGDNKQDNSKPDQQQQQK
jgi:hypothetical protein